MRVEPAWGSLVSVTSPCCLFYQFYPYLVAHPTARKWVITPVINGISRVNPLIIGVITHLLSGMSHQVSLSFLILDDMGMSPNWSTNETTQFIKFCLVCKAVPPLVISWIIKPMN